eukprot:SAG22_NODE_6327_length_870_cov_1.040208_1_plen_53_part_10
MRAALRISTASTKLCIRHRNRLNQSQERVPANQQICEEEEDHTNLYVASKAYE